VETPESRESETGMEPDDPAGFAESARDQEEEVVVADLKTLLGIKNNHIREAYDRIAAAELAADEARAVREAAERRMEDLEEQRDRLRERVREVEEEEGRRRRSRDDHDRQASRAVRDLERKESEISRLERELEDLRREMKDGISLKDQALKDAHGRIEELERSLEDRETETAGLRSAVEGLRGELEEQKELQRRLAEPANRLRAGINLFNSSQHIKAVNTLSRDLGRPEVHAVLGDGDEPPAILTFTWQGITWQTYAADPGPAVEEPRVYLTSAGEDLSGVDRNPPNARLGPGGRVVLGL